MRAPARPHAAGARFVGAAAVVVLAVVTVNTLRTDAPGARGLPPGARLPPFAAPLATSALEGDANLAVRGAGGRPACAVRGADVVNSCALAERGPVVLSFVAVRPARCLDQLPVLDRAARARPGVQVAAVAIRGDRDA